METIASSSGNLILFPDLRARRIRAQVVDEHGAFRGCVHCPEFETCRSLCSIFRDACGAETIR